MDDEYHIHKQTSLQPVRRRLVMTLTLRLPALAGAMTAAFCLATLAPTASNEAVAQGIRVYVAQPQNYGYGSGYTSGYGSRYSSNPYGSYGNANYGYTYGNGAY